MRKFAQSHDIRGALESILGVLAAAFSQDSFRRRRRVRVCGRSSRVGLGARAPDCAVRKSGGVEVFDLGLANRAGTGTRRLKRTTLGGFECTEPIANGGVKLSSNSYGGSDSANCLTGGDHCSSVTATIVGAVGREALDDTSIGSIGGERRGDTSIGAIGGEARGDTNMCSQQKACGDTSIGAIGGEACSDTSFGTKVGSGSGTGVDTGIDGSKGSRIRAGVDAGSAERIGAMNGEGITAGIGRGLCVHTGIGVGVDNGREIGAHCE